MTTSATGQNRVHALLASLAQLLRSYQLYGPNGAPNARLLGNVRSQFEALWTVLPELEIGVTDRALLLGEDAVYEADATSESLPFCLYRDSIRTLTFLPSFELYELEAFVEVLHTARQRSDSHDLLTMLWERDFGYLRYAYVDLSASDLDDDNDGRTEAGDAASSPVARRVAAHMGSTGASGALAADDEDPAAGLAGYGGGGAAEEFRAPLDPDALPAQVAAGAAKRDLGLSADDLAYLRAEFELEMQRDVLLDVVNAVLDCIEDPIPRLQSQALRNIEQLLPQFVLRGRLDLAIWTLDELTRLAASNDPAVAPLGAELERIATEFTAAIVQGELLEGLQAAAGDHEEALPRLLAHCGAEALEPLVQWAGRARGRLRETVRAAASANAAKHPGAIAALFRNADAEVCAAALELCAKTQDARFVPQVAALLQHDATSVRTAAVQALTALGGTAALDALVGALGQQESEIRCAAAWGLGVWAHAPAAPRLVQILESKAFAASALPEKIALFDAYARVGGPEAAEWFAALLKSRFRLGRRPAADMRACAARALGTFGTPAARAALEAARDDKEAAVRTAVLRTLERMS